MMNFRCFNGELFGVRKPVFREESVNHGERGTATYAKFSRRLGVGVNPLDPAEIEFGLVVAGTNGDEGLYCGA